MRTLSECWAVKAPVIEKDWIKRELYSNLFEAGMFKVYVDLDTLELSRVRETLDRLEEKLVHGYRMVDDFDEWIEFVRANPSWGWSLKVFARKLRCDEEEFDNDERLPAAKAFAWLTWYLAQRERAMLGVR